MGRARVKCTDRIWQENWSTPSWVVSVSDIIDSWVCVCGGGEDEDGGFQSQNGQHKNNMEINNFISSAGRWWSKLGAGALICQKYTGMCRFDGTLLSCSSAAPETHILHLASVIMPSVFRSKNSAFLGPFLSNFGKISAPNTLISAHIRSQDPSFRSVDPTSENPCDTYPKKQTN